MDPRLLSIYQQIVEELSLTEVKAFKIGITSDVENREDDYLLEGYTDLYVLAKGNNTNIKQAESDLIKALMLDDRVCSKCKNESAKLGLGQTQEADVLYVAVRIQFDNTVSSLDIHLNNILFSNGFPIILKD